MRKFFLEYINTIYNIQKGIHFYCVTKQPSPLVYNNFLKLLAWDDILHLYNNSNQIKLFQMHQQIIE